MDTVISLEEEGRMSQVVGSLLLFIGSEIECKKGTFSSLPVDSSGRRDEITTLLEIVGMRLMYQNIDRERIEFYFPNNSYFTDKLIHLLHLNPIKLINFCGHLLDINNNTIDECIAGALS